MYGIVYLARCGINGKSYVGITTHSLRVRWTSHLREAKNNTKWLFYRAIAKYGPETFTLSVLEECGCRHSLNAAEMKWIAELKSFAPDGYNMTSGGGGTSGQKRSDEWKKNMADRMRGRLFSSETRAKMSVAKKGKPLSAAHIEKMIKIRLGTKRSDETKLKMSRALRGRKRSPEAIEKSRLARIGIPMKESARAALQRPVIAEGITFSGLHVAAAALNISASKISRRIYKGHPGYASLTSIRKRRPRTAEQVVAMKMRVSKPVVIDGVNYPSMTEAAAALGLTRPGVAYRVVHGVPGRPRKTQDHHAARQC